MPTSTYESLTSNTVLAYKRTHHLGRFDPNAPSIEAQKAAAYDVEIAERGIVVGKRCQLLPAETDARRGKVAFVGEVGEIPGVGKWVGVVLDEPTGKNDGSVGGKRYFECGAGCGVFVRPERVEIGEQFGVVDEFAEDSDEEF